MESLYDDRSRLTQKLSKAVRLSQLEQYLASTEYVQHFQLRNSGAPIPVYGKQTQKKLDAILESFEFNIDGKSFIDLGCNKGFFPLYAAAKGAYRAVGVDPDPELTKNGNEIAQLTGVPAEFHTGRFRLNLARDLGIFDISYVGSAYHYFWYEFRDHSKVFEALADITADVLIFEGPVNLDDRAWKNAVLRLTGDTEENVRKEFNDEAILGAAAQFFEVKYKGASGHANERYLYEMKRRKRQASHPALDVVSLKPERLLAVKADSIEQIGRTQEGVYLIDGEEGVYVKKKLRLKRQWCVSAIQRFEAYFANHPAPFGLCSHYGSAHQDEDLVLYQDYIADAASLVNNGNLAHKLLRQQVLHAVFRMQIDLLRAGLIHFDLFISNVLVKNGEVFIVDYEGLTIVDQDEYKQRFINFYTLNLLGFINQALLLKSAGRDDLLAISGVEFYGNGVPGEYHGQIIDCLNPQNASIHDLFKKILEQPSLISSVSFYEAVLAELPSLLE